MIGVAFGYHARSTARDFTMNKCSDELWTIAVALDCHQDADPKAVMNRVLQRICDYQTVRRLALNAADTLKNGTLGDDRFLDAFHNLESAARAMDRAYWVPNPPADLPMSDLDGAD